LDPTRRLIPEVEAVVSFGKHLHAVPYGCTGVVADDACVADTEASDATELHSS